MIYNVITSLSRFQNLRPLSWMLDDHDITWHVVTDESPFFRLESNCSWIKVYQCHNQGGAKFWARCHYALNWFLDHVGVEKDQYYSFLNDDDTYEPDYWKRVDEVASSNRYVDEVLVTSMMRGDKIPGDVAPERAHGTNTLIAALDNMKPGHVGLEQVIVKGSLLHKARIPMVIDGDGRMIEWLCNAYTPTLIPEIFVWFNYLEPGRWQK